MTNGEKMINAFPNGEVRKCEKGVVFSTGGWCHAYAEEWWNAECEEPTTKNGLEVEKAIEIIKADSLAPYSVNDILSARDLAVEALKQMTTTKNDLGVDCISRDEVCCYVAEFINHEFSTKEEEELIDNIITGIERMPSVTPQEPRKGHWISTETKGARYAFWCRYKCSLCGGLSDCTNFCPNCGADMREVEE